MNKNRTILESICSWKSHKKSLWETWYRRILNISQPDQCNHCVQFCNEIFRVLLIYQNSNKLNYFNSVNIISERKNNWFSFSNVGSRECSNIFSLINLKNEQINLMVRSHSRQSKMERKWLPLLKLNLYWGINGGRYRKVKESNTFKILHSILTIRWLRN